MNSFPLHFCFSANRRCPCPRASRFSRYRRPPEAASFVGWFPVSVRPWLGRQRAGGPLILSISEADSKSSGFLSLSEPLTRLLGPRRWRYIQSHQDSWSLMNCESRVDSMSLGESSHPCERAGRACNGCVSNKDRVESIPAVFFPLIMD